MVARQSSSPSCWCFAADVNKAAGGRDREVKLYLEGRVTDSVTDEVLMVGISELRGEDLENAKTKLEAKQLNHGMRQLEAP
jgi:hypothetical protein